MASDSCATCAQSYSDSLASISEKPLFPGRYMSCCSRSICARCLNQNRRYESYCPYCQISTRPTTSSQGLRDPPAYSTSTIVAAESPEEEQPPPYRANGTATPTEKSDEDRQTPDVLHFLKPNDTIRSLALAYGVPAEGLRKINNIFSDHLVQGRRTVLVPGEFYKGGVSLSPQPVEGVEEETRKTKIRRWMVICKVSE